MPEHTLAFQDVVMLVEATQLPWLSLGTLAARTGQSLDEVAERCASLVKQGLLQSVCTALAAYPKQLYAITDSGLCAGAAMFGVSSGALARRAHLTEARFWALRAGWQVAQEVNAVCMRTNHAVAQAHGRVEWETFVERRIKRQPFYLHGRMAVHSGDSNGDGVRPFYLLLERGEPSPWGWYRALKYLQTWAARQSSPFPPLLVIARRALSAQIVLNVSHMAGGVMTFATFERHAALANGLMECNWHMIRPDRHIVPADPFQLPAIAESVYATSVHRVRRIEWPDLAIRRPAPQTPWTGFNLCELPRQIERLPEIDQLNDVAYRLLTFLATHPVCPATTLAEFCGMTLADAVAHILALQALGFAEPIAANEREARWLPLGSPARTQSSVSENGRRIVAAIRKHPNRCALEIARLLKLPLANVVACLKQLADAGLIEAADSRPEHTLWAATDAAVRLVAARALQPIEQAVRRHRFFCADHARRRQHTTEVYAFFEALHRHCAQRSRASASFGACVGKVDDGLIPNVELTDFHDEMSAAAWYVYRGHARFWRPDGAGLLRADRDYTPFWLEMDGTTTTRSRRDAALWEDKLGRMCDYLASDHWRLKHDAFPRLLIVSSAVRNRAIVTEALDAAARSRSIEAPLAFITGHEALAQRGPLGPIWFHVASGVREATYAFGGAAQQVVQPTPPRRNLLDDLQQAEQMGLIDIVAPLRK